MGGVKEKRRRTPFHVHCEAMGNGGPPVPAWRGKLVIVLPLIAYLGYVLHLVAQSSRPFLLRWLEGCFGLFIALVFANILRRAVAGDRDEGGQGS